MRPRTGRLFFLLFFCFPLVAVGSSGPAGAGEIDPSGEYRACMDLARQDPPKGFDAAVGWQGLGGGDAAAHCAAAALMGLKQYAEAAGRFEALAQRVRAGKPFKASLLAQAGQALLLDGNGVRAEQVLTAALKLTPGNADLLVDRAQAWAAQKLYWDAVDDLNHALELNPGLTEARVFRASAYRYLDSLDLAMDDLNTALAQAPDHPEGLLERGMVRRLKGNTAGARQDWLRLLRGAPNSDAARTAQANLQAMDLKTD